MIHGAPAPIPHGRCVECMDGSVVLLELLSRLVEVLDALAPAESTVGAASPALAVPCFRELVCDALNEALGLRGFLPLCISYVKGSPLEELETVTFLSFLFLFLWIGVCLCFCL